MDLVLDAGLLVVVLFSEFCLVLVADGVVGLDVARVWVRWFISLLTNCSSCTLLNFGPLVFSTVMMLSRSIM